MSTTWPPPTSHHHHHQRLRHFRLPDGREVHIALSQEEAESLRTRLLVIRADESFDLVIRGSEDYLSALRSAHRRYEERLEELKQMYGETYNIIYSALAELDALGSELHMASDHSVSLDGNFSKYGYSAHLRSHNDDQSQSAPPVGKFPDEKKDWGSDRWKGKVLKIYQEPHLRQYFHKGLLWRSCEATQVAPFELFFDLLYAGALTINGDHAADNPTGNELLRFSITFLMGWRIWDELNLIISWIEADDVLRRLLVMLIMIFLLGFTNNMLNAFQDTYAMTAAFYIAARLSLCFYFLYLARVIPMARGMMLSQALKTAIPTVIWVASIYIDMPLRLAAIWVAILFELTSSIFLTSIIRNSKHISERTGKWSDRVFEFYPAINIEHKVGRTNCFVTLILGYSVVATIYQNTAPAFLGLNAFFGKATLGLIQAFFFSWLYFEIDGADLFSHAIRRNVASAWLWQFMHLPFIMSFNLAATALSKLVLATDCGNTKLEDLTATYKAKSDSQIPSGLRWFYCVGLGIALFSMTIISICHVHKEPEKGNIRLRKRVRIISRFVICIILFCLPTAQSLNSLQLLSTTTGLISWVLVLELWGTSNPSQKFSGGTHTSRYTAKTKISKKI